MSGLFFRLLTVYGTHISTWQDLADWAKLAGYDLFHDNSGWPQQCHDGILQQRAAYEAFRAIGYPGYSTGYMCTCVESCDYE